MATKKTAAQTEAPEEEQAPESEPAPAKTSTKTQTCSNCGESAKWKTRNPGANVDYYCEGHARMTYPEPEQWLERL